MSSVSWGSRRPWRAKVAEHPPSDRVLEALQELAGEGGGFVEPEAGIRAGGVVLVIRAWLDLLEEAVNHDEMKVKVRIQRGTEAVQEAQRSEGGGGGAVGQASLSVA